jgi:hypothetical protein
MSIQEKLLEKGYKKYVSKSNAVFKSTDTLFQKKVVDDKGVRYFIDCWWYKEEVINGHTIQESWQFEVQYSSSPVSNTMNVMLFEKDIDKAEQMFDHMWTVLNLGYYEED